MSYNNQKFIVNNKDYSGIDYEKISFAMKELNGAALKLYIYFCGFGCYEKFPFSPQEIANECNISAMSARRGLEEMLEKKYVEVEDDEYVFTP